MGWCTLVSLCAGVTEILDFSTMENGLLSDADFFHYCHGCRTWVWKMGCKGILMFSSQAWCLICQSVTVYCFHRALPPLLQCCLPGSGPSEHSRCLKSLHRKWDFLHSTSWWWHTDGKWFPQEIWKHIYIFFSEVFIFIGFIVRTCRKQPQVKKLQSNGWVSAIIRLIVSIIGPLIDL